MLVVTASLSCGGRRFPRFLRFLRLLLPVHLCKHIHPTRCFFHHPSTINHLAVFVVAGHVGGAASSPSLFQRRTVFDRS
jgi:hypothetical protein